MVVQPFEDGIHVRSSSGLRAIGIGAPAHCLLLSLEGYVGKPKEGMF